MAGQTDTDLIIGANTRLLESQTFEAVRRIESKPVRVRFDATGLGQINGQIGQFEKALQSSTARVLAFGSSAGQVFLLARALDTLVRSTIDVQKELADINNILGLSSKQLEGFSGSLFKVANETGQSFKSAANSALEFSRQGLSVAETLKRTKDALTLTRLSGLDVVESTKAITAALNSFNDVALDSTVLVNKLLTVDSQFAVSSSDLAQSLQRVGSVAQDTGVSFDSLIALVTSAQTSTQRGGAVIGNALKSIFQRIQRPEVLDNLKQLGILTEDINGKTLASDAILKNVAKSYNGLSDSQKEVISSLSAGLFQVNQFKAILQDLGKSSSIYERALNTSTNATDQAARRQAELNKTLASQFNEAVNNAQQFAAKVGNISIAPALNNIFKGINFASNTGLGDALGEGILKGLGNYLSGPGLALGGVLITKLFTSFAGQAAKSFASILEVSSVRIQNERIITELLKSESGAVDRINAAGGKTIEVQQIINELLTKQNATLNANAAAAAKVAEITSLFSLPGGAGLARNSFSVSGDKVVANPRAKFIPNNSALSDAITRERKMGVDPSLIRVGSSAQLISADNPLGIGIYNTKDEPLGLQQGINRAVKSGNNPKKAGTEIPNFADDPFPFLPDRFKNPPIPPFDIRSLVPESVLKGPPPNLIGRLVGEGQLDEFGKTLHDANIELKNVVSSLSRLSLQAPKSQLLLNAPKPETHVGEQTFLALENRKSNAQLEKELYDRFPNFSGQNNPETSTIGNAIFKLSNNPNILSAQAKRFNVGNQRAVDSSILLASGVNGEKSLLREQVNFQGIRNHNIIDQQIDKYLDLIAKGAEASSVEMQKFRAQIIENTQKLSYTTQVIEKDANGTVRGIRTIDNGSTNVSKVTKVLNEGGALATAISEPTRIAKLESEALSLKINDAEKRLNKLNLLNFAFKDNGLKNESESLGLQGSFAKARQRVAGQALLGSFAAPIIAGAAQTGAENLFGNNSTTSRGAVATVGGLGNVASYALTGLGVAGGNPLGAAGGAAVGIALELPSVIKAFSDTLPDLQKRLEILTETSQKTSASFATYITTSQQLAAIGKDLSATEGQKRLLQSQNSAALAGIPGEARGRIRTAVARGDYAEASNIADIANTVNSQNINFGNDAKLLNVSSQVGGIAGFLKSIGASSGNYSDKGIGGELVRGGESDLAFANLGQIQQFSGSLLSRINGVGKTLGDVLTPQDLDKIQSSRSGGIPAFLSTLKPILSKNGFGGQFNDISQQITEGSKNNPDLVSKVLFGAFSSSNLNSLKENAKIIDATTESYNNALSTINSNLVKLTEEAKKSVNDFDINISQKLSKSISDINVKSINRQGANQISLVNSGSNSYLKNYLDFQEKLAKNKDDFDSSNKQLEAELKTSSAGAVTSGRVNLLNTFQQQIEANRLNGNGEDANANFAKTSSFVSSIFGGINLNNPEEAKKQLTERLGYTEKLRKEQPVIENINSGLKQAGLGDISGLEINKSDLESIQKELRGVIDTINDSLLKYSKDLASVQSNLDSNDKNAGAEFNSAANLLRAQAKITRNSVINSGIIGRNNVSAQGIFQRQQIGSTPFQNSTLQANSQFQDVLTGVRENLSTQLPARFNVNNIDRAGIGALINTTSNNVNNLKSNGPSQALTEQQGILENLINAADKLDEADKNRNQYIEEQNKLLELQLSFTDRISAAVLETNTGKAAQGTLTGKDYANAALAPLAYNPQTFNRDAITGLQDFSRTLKDDLTTSIHQVTAGAKNASEAFRDLGLSLAQSLADKASTIGINALFGLGVNALGVTSSSLLARANGGNIPKYAKGGFVNQGSGVRDDVPAFLSGGEFVINKRAVNKIGKSKLDALNDFAGTESDSISGNSNAANITLANAYNLSANGQRGKLNASPLLSLIGQSDSNNPQNNIKSSREKYALQKRLAYKQYQDQLAAYNVQQYISLGQAYVGAVGSIALAGFSASGGTSGSSGAPGGGATGGTSFSPYSEAGNSAATFGTNSSPSYFTNFGAFNSVRAKGGYIPKYAEGGYFGGDSSSDKFKAMVMGGEYVVNPKTVNKYGVNYFKGLNDTAKYADGGYVGNIYGKDDSGSEITTILSQIRDKLGGNSSSNGTNSQSNSQVINVTNNFTMKSDGSVGSSSTSTSSDNNTKTSDTDAQNLKKFSDQINNQTIAILTKESRPGGLLETTFAKKRS